MAQNVEVHDYNQKVEDVVCVVNIHESVAHPSALFNDSSASVMEVCYINDNETAVHTIPSGVGSEEIVISNSNEIIDVEEPSSKRFCVDHDYIQHVVSGCYSATVNDECINGNHGYSTDDHESEKVTCSYLNDTDCEVQAIPSGVTCEETVVESNCDTSNAKVAKRISRHCSVVGCCNNNSTCTLFSYPRVMKKVDGVLVRDECLKERCQKWADFSGNDKVKTVDITILHGKYYICEAHFASHDIIQGFKTKKLQKDATPSLFGPQISTTICSNDQDVVEDVPIMDPTGFEENVHQRFEKRMNDLKSARSKMFSKKFDDMQGQFTWKQCDTCNEKYMYYPGMKRAHRGKQHCWKFSKQNNMDPGVVPNVLKELTHVEEQLISRIHPVMSVHKLKHCQYGYKGNVINFSQDVKTFAKTLPHRIEDLNSIITVRFENNKGSICDFRVRSQKVKDALMWLKEHNDKYHDIDISENNLEDLPEDDNVFDQIKSMNLASETTEEDTDSDTDINSEEESNDTIVNSSGVPLSELHCQNDQISAVLNWPEMSSEPVSESTPGFIMCAFPTLFPYGNCDLKDPRDSPIKLHDYFKHFMSYGDDRFAQHPTFRFFAFNMWQRHSALSSGNVFMKKDGNLANMNVDQLKDYINENPSYLKKLMFFGSNIRGSKAYWKSRCGELKDMIEQIGLPTIFLTMSAADLYWPDLFRLLADKDVNEINMRERRRLLQENPLVVDMFFHHRLECFTTCVLEPKYEVVDFWYGIEYQHRGSPHVHALYWLKNAPDITKYIDGNDEEQKKILEYFDELVCAVNPNNDCAMPNSHPCETKGSDVVDVETDLAQMLKNVQRHTRCSPAYCQRTDKKTKKTVCRFHFPIEIEPVSKIVVKTEPVEIEFVPERNDNRLNKFNPFIISTWRANIDIAPVLSKRAIIEYLSKYVSKSEVRSQTLKDITSSVCSSLDGADPAKRAVHRILIKNSVERDISAQECCHILMGLKLVSSGKRDFVVLYTTATDWIPLPTDNQSGECQREMNVGTKTIMVKYSERPEGLNSMTLWQVAKNYKASSWKKCVKSNIVRVFPRLVLSDNEEKNEEFYRQKVLLHVPWRSIETLKGENESWREVYDRNEVANVISTQLDINMCMPSVEEDVDMPEVNHEDNEDWMIAARLSSRVAVESVELGRREVDINYDWHASWKEYEPYGNIKFFKNFLENEKKKDNEDLVFDELPSVTFSPEQASVKQLMEEQIKFYQTGNTANIPFKRVLVQGKAGTGKSLLIKFLCENLRKQFGQGSYLLLGPTGVAAINIGGSTVHSALRIPAKTNNFKELKGDAARKFCDMIQDVKFIILDEYSMVGCSMLGMIDKRLKEGTGVNEPMGGLCTYFFGDYKQLPPVKDTALYGGNCVSDIAQHGRNIFNSFEVHFMLTKGHRQQDGEFQELLDRLSVGEVTLQDYNLLKTRFNIFVNREVHEQFNGAIRLFSTKEQVASYNMQCLHNMKDKNGDLCPVARIPAKHHGFKANTGTTDEADGLANVMYLAKGSIIMLRTNLWVKRGLVNGSIGTVVDMLYEPGTDPSIDGPSILMCKFENYTGHGIGPDNLVPIAPIVRSWTSTKGEQCSRQQFPMVLCYGCSIHKSQGLTLDKAVIDIGSKEFALGLTYVGLSRVKSIEGLLLVPFAFERLQTIKLKPDMLRRKEFAKRLFNK